MWKQRCLMICGPLVAFQANALAQSAELFGDYSLHAVQPNHHRRQSQACTAIESISATRMATDRLTATSNPPPKRHGKRVLRLAGGVDLPPPAIRALFN